MGRATGNNLVVLLFTPFSHHVFSLLQFPPLYPSLALQFFCPWLAVLLSCLFGFLSVALPALSLQKLSAFLYSTVSSPSSLSMASL